MKNNLPKPINEQAPVKTLQTILINAPVEKVWHVLTDINNWKSWQQDITFAQINGPLKPGTSFDWKSGGMSIHSTLHTVEPFTAVGWSGKAPGSLAIHNWSFVQQNEATTVSVEESMEGWLVRLLKRIFQPKLVAATQRWLNYLKLQSEKGQ